MMNTEPAREREEDPYLELLLRVLSTYDAPTAAHVQRVASLAVEIAATMDAGVDRARLREAALLHDIGKVGVPDKILYKPGALSDEELEWLRNRWLSADYILQAAPPLSHLRDIICHIYEKWDGTGFPEGLHGEQIPLETRIIAVADAFDALTSDQPYRNALSRSEAHTVLQDGAGGRWDPGVVTTLLSLSPAAR